MMELLSNNTVPQQMANSNAPSAVTAVGGGSGVGASNAGVSVNGGSGSGSGSISSNASNSSERLLAGILESFPAWDLNVGLMPNVGAANGSPPRTDFFINNFLGGLETHGDHFGMGPIGSGVSRHSKMSPESSNNSSISCGWCEVSASIRCLECNEFMCNDCLREHRNSPLSSNHSIVSLPTPIGASPTGGSSSNVQTPSSSNFICDIHNEMLRYVCDYCRKLVCQFCTLHEHKEHSYASIQNFMIGSKEKLEGAIESSQVGTRCIKSSIDKALAFIRLIERNCSELSDNIRKAFRQFIIAIEDRERFLLDFVEKLRQRRLAILHDQMAGLKSALAGLSETSDMLSKVADNACGMDQIELAMKLTNGQRQMEQFAGIYKDLQPKQEVFAFAPPDYSLLQDIRTQGGVILVDDKNMPIVSSSNGIVANAAPTAAPAAANIDMSFGLTSLAGSGALNVASTTVRRPLLRDNSFRIPSPIMQPARVGSSCGMSSAALDWELNGLRSSPGLHFSAPRTTQAIPGCMDLVKVRNSNALSLSFATEGHEDGQVSRPWGLCVDKMGHVLVSDRRNNRVQVFNPDGSLKFKFGRKGVGNGEFDLPAGICVDVDNRIIVVDKDNHRVQIFTASGVFLLKFGSYGKEYGQFQYPWDVAVNSRRQIVVTDSRNHRIQQFDSEGRFIRQIVFDNHGQTKGIASPRGVCYTPTGNIIVSDFDNHCLYLIDPDINDILSVKGHEGSGFHEFNRPSGLCCDDEGRIIVADSKNQRILVFNQNLDFMWDIEVRPSINPLMPPTLDEKDRTCDVALMPDGRIVFLIELSPDSKEGSNPYKRFVHVF
ncbi:protein wech [Drosophila hydei]|uniref:Protein wech n=1 Tax=Drosophila hydei TaxID=7224 RepID=A0A6J1LYB7_DROHY|nr:protein wech [Drosophila hydei]XP_030079720.1 protein wech [Drosophila hydei]